MSHYIHVFPGNIAVFDDKGDIKEKKKISLSKFTEAAYNGKEIEEEKQLLKKYPDATKPEIKSEIFQKILVKLKDPALFKDMQEYAKEMTSNKLRNLSMKDFMICQAVNNIDEMERILNTMSTRLREWYSLYNPELSKRISDHFEFAKSVLDFDKKGIKKDKSIGGNISRKDLEQIYDLAKQVKELYEFRERNEQRIVEVMQEYCPNTSAIATEMLAARLIALSGSLRKLSAYPSSTIQTLGAEKAMFRHLKTKDRPPKHGIIIMHPMINNQKKSDKGRAARALASKISIAAKIDYFGGEEYKGYELRENIEKQFSKVKKNEKRETR
ncbi:MAG: NOP5/NOP56 family protein [Nanoarchaeota archaeon]